MTTTTITTTSIPNEEELKKIIESQLQNIENLEQLLDEQDCIDNFQSNEYSSLQASLDTIMMYITDYGSTINELELGTIPPPEYMEQCLPFQNLISKLSFIDHLHRN